MSSFSSSLTGSKGEWLVIGPLVLGVALCASAILFVLRPRASAVAAAPHERGGAPALDEPRPLGWPSEAGAGVAPSEVLMAD